QPQDLELCDDISNDGFETFDLTQNEGDILGTQNASDFTITYHNSQMDADMNTAAIPNPGSYTNTISPVETIYVRVTPNGNMSCAATGSFDIQVDVLPVANVPMDMIVCDDDSNDGIEVFDLASQTATILGTQNPADFNISYHSSQLDADSNTSPLNAAAYTNAGTGPEIIFVRVENVLNTSCIATTTFIVQVDPQAIFNQPQDLELCDDISNDGFETFDLTQNEGDILGTQNASDFTITYHNSQMDADMNTAAIPNPGSYTNTISPVETIYVRVTPNGNMSCAATGSFDIQVDVLPVANVPMDMIVCDDDSNDGIEVFDLASQTATILGTQNPADFNISYHNSQVDADSNTSPLNAAAYTNAGTGPETIFVRVENVLNTSCIATTTFIVQVDPQAIFNQPQDLELCDDISNDGFETFDLTQNEVDILGTQNAADFTITYHNSQMDADMNAAAIPNPTNYTNVIATQETIFVRITPVGNMTCFTTGTFTVNVESRAIANPVGDIILCDDPSNDGTEVFDLASQTATILGTQNPADVNITYHNSQADADNNTGALALNYDNISSPEIIYVRAESVNNTACYSTVTFELILNTAPVISVANNLELCDDPSGDATENFDLSQNDAAILNGLNPADYLISYHTSQADADSGTGSVATNYDNTTSPETIYVRVENILTGCVNTSNFDLILNEVPAIVNIPDLEECDDDGDTIAVFTLNDRENDIVNGQTGVAVTYYASGLDAMNDTAALDENSYTNTANPQVISYRLTTLSTGCFSIGTFTIEAVPSPIAVMPMDVENCDDGSGNTTADLNTVTPQVIGAQTGLTVSYHESQVDADNAVNGVSLNYEYGANTTLYVRVEDDNTGCVTFTTVDLIILPLPQPSLLLQYVICIDTNGVLLNGPEVLDTGLNDLDYSFEWFLNGSVIAGATSPIHNATEPGDYEVVVTTIATGCENSSTTNVRQSGIPTDYSVEVTTETYAVDHQIIVTANGPDEYWFRLDDGPYVNSRVFNNVTPGLHTVTIAERSGCGEIVVEVFVFGYPDYFTPNNDGFHDTWNIVGADRLPATTLYIYDRYGKLLKQLDPSGPGWDGTYNGQPLPSSDYWFTIEYVQDGRKGQATGHFAMKR
ncbi:T9SS type B sorting domain-containing protein, partial [Nonlabens sp.]|uniref:T9SS type B sorting domain-containing protein n=1 Tax=Nonlabens sp. TaxID=1888209 RepID=UPI003F6A20F3